ncbi:ester cyclase [uncultured Shewanella sp.]|uniref:nuclear transport factor 2 family protein n=1 Tax=uncultured Shewanella sp. TaxID=173975 RepID=UPI00261507D0|nr:ester cyclase [uncultured Shewanella sp.]
MLEVVKEKAQIDNEYATEEGAGLKTVKHGESISQKNIDIVLAFYDGVFSQRKVECCHDLMKADYINHSQFVENGRENFKAYFNTFYQKFKHSGTKVELVFADKDWVCLHATHWASNRLFTVKLKCVDIYRLEQGQLAEHWDSVEGLTVFSRLVFFLKSFLRL